MISIVGNSFLRLFDRNELPIVVTAVVSLAVLPMVAAAIWIKVFTSAAIFAIAASGASLVYARLGLVNLAQVALVGIGGWIMLRLNYATGLPFEVSLLLSGAGAALVGMVLSIPAMRMRGLYLALVTLMAAGAFQIVFTAFQFPNGGSGFWGVALQSPGEMRRPALAQSDSGLSALRYRCGRHLLHHCESARKVAARTGMGHDPAIGSQRHGDWCERHLLQGVGRSFWPDFWPASPAVCSPAASRSSMPVPSRPANRSCCLPCRSSAGCITGPGL